MMNSLKRKVLEEKVEGEEHEYYWKNMMNSDSHFNYNPNSMPNDHLNQVINFNNYHQVLQHEQELSNCYSMANKTRIKWTTDLHNLFLQSVDRLGGAEKATPKLILKLMEAQVQGLTIFHIKSHLQKHRVARYIPESREEKSHVTDLISILDPKKGIQSIAETLQLQLDVQKRLHQQLEIQRNLQSRIEEQGRQLKQMLDQQLKSNNTENSD